MDIIVYCYYRGIIFTALDMKEEAIESFKLCLSLPTQICHKVHIECFKKLILLNLIVYKTTPVLPQYVNPLMRMKLEHGTTKYQQVAQTFLNKDDDGFILALQEGQNDFIKDMNLGLIKRFKAQYEKYRIKALSYTYLTLNYKYVS